MCMSMGGSAPKPQPIPIPPPPPVPPPAPAPVEMASGVGTPAIKNKQVASRRRGRSSLVIDANAGVDYGANVPA